MRRQAAYDARQKALGLVTVRLMVPKKYRKKIMKIAAEFRALFRKERKK